MYRASSVFVARTVGWLPIHGQRSLPRIRLLARAPLSSSIGILTMPLHLLSNISHWRLLHKKSDHVRKLEGTEYKKVKDYEVILCYVCGSLPCGLVY